MPVDALAARNGISMLRSPATTASDGSTATHSSPAGRRLGTSIEAHLAPRQGSQIQGSQIQGSQMRLDARSEIIMREYGAPGMVSAERIAG